MESLGQLVEDISLATEDYRYMEEKFRVKVAESLRRARREAGFSQKRLAEALGVTPPYISQLENGHSIPSVTLCRSILSILEGKETA